MIEKEDTPEYLMLMAIPLSLSLSLLRRDDYLTHQKGGRCLHPTIAILVGIGQWILRFSFTDFDFLECDGAGGLWASTTYTARAAAARRRRRPRRSPLLLLLLAIIT
jgi:hypothetical protein